MEMVQQGNQLPATAPANWGTEGLSSRDLVLARVRTLQAISQDVQSGRGKPGDMLNSITGEMLAEKGKPLELLPVLSLRFWNVYEKVGNNFEFSEKYPMTEANQDDQREFFSHDGKPMVRVQALSFLCLVPGKLATLPIFVDFQRTNLQAGKNLSTIMQENGFQGKPGCARVVSLTTEITTYNKNSWFVQRVAPVREATQEEIAACYKWYQTFLAKQQNIKVDDEAVTPAKDVATDNGVF